mmetsp:Transcript_45768/g.141600  ORF Transcript_45768/g.141600 Transcript_45768/m.141600 type:complete len:402 (+) Transcript_45768:1486-2691(+)
MTGNSLHPHVARPSVARPLDQLQHLAGLGFADRTAGFLCPLSQSDGLPAPQEGFLHLLQVCGSRLVLDSYPAHSAILDCAALHPRQLELGVLLRSSHGLHELAQVQLPDLLRRLDFEDVGERHVARDFANVRERRREDVAPEAVRGYPPVREPNHLLGEVKVAVVLEVIDKMLLGDLRPLLGKSGEEAAGVEAPVGPARLRAERSQGLLQGRRRHALELLGDRPCCGLGLLLCGLEAVGQPLDVHLRIRDDQRALALRERLPGLVDELPRGRGLLVHRLEFGHRLVLRGVCQATQLADLPLGLDNGILSLPNDPLRDRATALAREFPEALQLLLGLRQPPKDAAKRLELQALCGLQLGLDLTGCPAHPLLRLAEALLVLLRRPLVGWPALGDGGEPVSLPV